MTVLPKSRLSELAVRTIDNEILIYDLQVNKAYHLYETATFVFQHCDGKTTIGELKLKSQYADDLIYLTLDELRKYNLLKE